MEQNIHVRDSKSTKSKFEESQYTSYNVIFMKTRSFEEFCYQKNVLHTLKKIKMNKQTNK